MSAHNLRVALPAKVSKHLVDAATADATNARRGAYALTLLPDAAPNTSTEWDEIAAHADAVDWVARKVIDDVVDLAYRLEETSEMLFKERGGQ